MRNVCGLIASILILISISTAALADQVILKNGDRTSGTIVSSDVKTLTLKTDYAGTVAIQWDAIQAVTSTHPVFVISKNGQTLVGPVSTEEGNLAVQTAKSGTVTVPKSDVTNIRSQGAQAAYEAQIQRLEHPRLLDFWSGAINSGLATASGNTQTTTFNLGINAARTAARDKISLTSAALFARSTVLGKTQTTASLVRGGMRYDLNVTSKSFAFGQLDLLHDRFEQLDLRTVLAGGYGYHAVKTKTTALDLLAGGSFDHDSFSTSLTRSAGEILLGDTFSRKLTKAVAFTQDVQFFPNLTHTGQYRFILDAGLVTTLSKWLSWQIAYTDIFLSNPVVGVKKNDTLLTTGISVTFGHKPQ